MLDAYICLYYIMEVEMNTIIELQGRIFESRAIGARFGVSNQAIQRWKDTGYSPRPSIGKAEFFDRDELDRRLVATRKDA